MKSNRKSLSFYPVQKSSNSLRHQKRLTKNILFKSNKLVKLLIIGLKENAGRCFQNGRITVRGKGGGCSKNYFILTQLKVYFYSILIGTFYDPNRSSFVSLNFNLLEKTFFYNLSVEKVYPGSLISFLPYHQSLRLGSRYPINYLPIGTLINNISFKYHYCSKYVKAAGTYGIILQKTNLNNIILFPSKAQLYLLSKVVFATLGVIDSSSHKGIVLGKAGKNRLLGKRPKVRGIAMNPVDHPNGGRSNGGCHFKTPWGKLAKGKKTVLLKSKFLR